MANPMYGQNKFDNANNRRVLLVKDYGTAGATHTNTTTAADLFTWNLPGGSVEEGDVLRVKIYATVTDNNSTDTLTPVINFGGTAIATGAALDVADSDIIWCEADIHITAVGSAGTMSSYAQISSDAAGATELKARTLLTSKDTTGNLAIALNVDWSVAHAENIVRLDAVRIEIV